MNFNYFAKSSIIDVLQDPKYTLATHSKYRVESVWIKDTWYIICSIIDHLTNTLEAQAASLINPLTVFWAAKIKKNTGKEIDLSSFFWHTPTIQRKIEEVLDSSFLSQFFRILINERGHCEQNT